MRPVPEELLPPAVPFAMSAVEQSELPVTSPQASPGLQRQTAAHVRALECAAHQRAASVATPFPAVAPQLPPIHRIPDAREHEMTMSLGSRHHAASRNRRSNCVWL